MTSKKKLTFKQILKLRPTFQFGHMTMVDWFIISHGASFCCIRSGLRHGEEEIKSPFYYEDCVGGDNAEKIGLKKFNDWWFGLDYQLKLKDQSNKHD